MTNKELYFAQTQTMFRMLGDTISSGNGGIKMISCLSKFAHYDAYDVKNYDDHVDYTRYDDDNYDDANDKYID